MIRRILLKGGSGAGKTTLAKELSQRLELPRVELDALHHGPNWSPATAEELQARLAQTLDDSIGWVVDGNYDHKLGSMLLDRAQLILWLDFPLRTKLRRLFARTARRWISREELWNGNRESLKESFYGFDALFPWAIRSHFSRRQVWPSAFAGRNVVRLHSPQHANDWLHEFTSRSRR